MKKKLLSALRLVFFLGLGLLFIWLFLRNLSPDQKQEIWASFLDANYWWALLSIVLGIISHLIRAMRWQILLKPMGYNPRIGNTFSAVMVGYLANLALPRLGEVTRCTILAKYEKVPFQKSFGTVIVERAIDLVIFGLLFLVVLLGQWSLIKDYVFEKIYAPLAAKFAILQDVSLVWAVLAASAGVLLLFLIIFRKRFSHLSIYQRFKTLVLGFWEGLRSVTRIERPWTFIFQSLLIWVFYFLMLYLCFFCFVDSSSLGIPAGLAMLVFGSIGIMVVQGGIGIYPAIIAEAASLYGLALTTGYALGWLAWTAQTVMIIVAGGIALVLLPLKNKTNESSAAAA